MPLGLLAEAGLGQPRIAHHEVAHDQRRLDGHGPFPILLLAAGLLALGVVIAAFAAVSFHPGGGPLELGLIVDALLDPAHHLGHVHRLAAHVEVREEEVLVHDAARDAHGGAAHAQVGLAAHLGDRQAGAREEQQLAAHVLGNRAVVLVLHVAAVDAEGGQALLGVAGQCRRQVHRPGALGAVEAPHRLGHDGIRVHHLGAVAPAGRDREADRDPFTLELLRAGGGLRHGADAGVGDDAFHGHSIRVPQLAREERCRRLGHGHHLLLQRLAHPFAPAVDDRTDPDLGDAPLQALASRKEGEVGGGRHGRGSST